MIVSFVAICLANVVLCDRPANVVVLDRQPLSLVVYIERDIVHVGHCVGARNFHKIVEHDLKYEFEPPSMKEIPDRRKPHRNALVHHDAIAVPHTSVDPNPLRTRVVVEYTVYDLYDRARLVDFFLVLGPCQVEYQVGKVHDCKLGVSYWVNKY